MMQDPTQCAKWAHLPEHASTRDGGLDLLRELERLGFAPRLHRSECGLTTPGIGMQPSVRALQTCSMTRHWQLERMRRLLFERCSVTLSFSDADLLTARELEQLLRQLHRAIAAPCVDPRRLGLALCRRHLPLPAYLLMSRVWLGNGPRFVILDESMSASDASTSEQAVFSALYQQRIRERALSPVYGSYLRSRCALLPDERGVAIAPPFALVSPPDSAWLPISFNLCRFCDSRGRLNEAEVFATLRAALRLADSLFDSLYWTDAEQRQDARENRRIAFFPEGIGDLVVLRREDPSGIACLRSLDRLFAGMHECLWDESRRLAHSRGLLPALAARDPLQHLPDAATRHRWQQRWQEALAGAAVRHRNLLVLSPYSLLPQNGAQATAFADLLPLLSYADALCFAGRPSFAHWRIKEFRAFHLRAAAVMRRRNAATFIATGV